MSRIKAFFLDVDGTLTDGKIYYSQSGEELKSFNIKDGLILSKMRKLGYEIVVITGRESSIVERRMKELGITEIYQSVSDKKQFFIDYLKENEISADEICFVGDDLNDISVMKLCGRSACPEDACEEVRMIADFVSHKNGGDGAVREIIEHLLKQDDSWHRLLSLFE